MWICYIQAQTSQSRFPVGGQLEPAVCSFAAKALDQIFEAAKKVTDNPERYKLLEL
jgi:hypothetical protein